MFMSRSLCSTYHPALREILKIKWYFISVYFGKNLIRGFVPKSRYIISVSGIALILESRDSSALFLLYGDIYNKYMYINQQKKQDQKGKVSQTDTNIRLLGGCYTFGIEMASKMSIYLSLGVKHKILSVIIMLLS